MTAPRGVVVRDARAADIDAVHAIEVSAFATPWRRESFRDLVLASPARLVVAATADGSVVGYAVLLVAADEAELANVAVSAAARRRGVARTLVRHVLGLAEAGGARMAFLEVRESNAAARALYATFGFSEIGRRSAYYQDPIEDAVVMRRPVGSAVA